MGYLTRLAAAVVGRSIENPSVSLTNPSDVDKYVFGVSDSLSGATVTQKTALSYPAVWRAVNLISSSVAKLPLIVYVRDGEGKQRATGHPAYKILKYKSGEHTAYQIKQSLTAAALLRGNGYGYIDRLGNGTPTGIRILDASQTYPVRLNGQLWYVTHVNGSPSYLSTSDVIHIRGLSFNGFEGLSVIEYLRESIGVGIAGRDYAASFFGNSARPDFVLEHPQRLTDEAVKRLRDSWNAMHQGKGKNFRPAILEEGMKVNPFSMSARDSQFLESRQFEIREVANIFGLPPHKLGDSSRTSYNSLEQENQSYLDDALDPWLVSWESECREKLLTESEKASDSHVIEFTRQALVRANMSTRAAYYNLGRIGGWLTVNEIRARENLNPLDEPAEPMTQQTPNDPTRSSLRAILFDSVSRMLRRLDHVRERGKAIEGEYLTVANALEPVIDCLRAMHLTALNLDAATDLVMKAAGEQDADEITNTIMGD